MGERVPAGIIAGRESARRRITHHSGRRGTGYLGAVFAKGAYGVVLCVFRPNTTNHELLESLAKEQYDGLPN
jgi:hypothetical protein